MIILTNFNIFKLQKFTSSFRFAAFSISLLVPRLLFETVIPLAYSLSFEIILIAEIYLFVCFCFR